MQDLFSASLVARLATETAHHQQHVKTTPNRRARLAAPGWPPVRHLPWSACPASLEADVEAFLSRQAGDDPMAIDGPPWALSPTTLRSYRGVLRSFAWSLVQTGVAPESRG
jgi:hypothetical protein